MTQDEQCCSGYPAPKIRINWVALTLMFLLFIGVQYPARAQIKKIQDMTTVRVRYMVKDLDPAVTFYTRYLDFQVKQEAKPNFAMLSRGNLELVLSTPYGPGGAAQPMSDGRRAEPGGWNRIILNVSDLPAVVDKLRKAELHFRNEIAKGPGGSEILLDDPSGNPIELFEAAK